MTRKRKKQKVTILNNELRTQGKTVEEAVKRAANQLGVSPETAREDACKIEHDISEETFDVIKRRLQA